MTITSITLEKQSLSESEPDWLVDLKSELIRARMKGYDIIKITRGEYADLLRLTGERVFSGTRNAVIVVPIFRILKLFERYELDRS